MVHLCTLANASILAADPAAASKDVGMDMDDKGGDTPKKKRRAGKYPAAKLLTKDDPPTQKQRIFDPVHCPLIHMSLDFQGSAHMHFQDACTPCQLNGTLCIPQVGKPTAVPCAECWTRKTKCHERAKWAEPIASANRARGKKKSVTFGEYCSLSLPVTLLNCQRHLGGTPPGNDGRDGWSEGLGVQQ